MSDYTIPPEVDQSIRQLVRHAKAGAAGPKERAQVDAHERIILKEILHLGDRVSNLGGEHPRGE